MCRVPWSRLERRTSDWLNLLPRRYQARCQDEGVYACSNNRMWMLLVQQQELLISASTERIKNMAHAIG